MKIKRLKYFLLVLAVAVAFNAGAQAVDSNSVIVHKDPRVDQLLRKQAEINLATKKANARTARGYRVLVISTNKRDEAMAAKARIYTNFPGLQTYLIYQSPFFRLKVGNFKTRDEAVQYQKALQTYFPKGVFIMNDTIEVTPESDQPQ